MKQKLRRQNRHQTEHIELNTSACGACWKCIKTCKKDVIGKIDLIIHKHAIIRKPDACAGCGACVRICPNEALSVRE